VKTAVSGESGVLRWSSHTARWSRGPGANRDGGDANGGLGYVRPATRWPRRHRGWGRRPRRIVAWLAGATQVSAFPLSRWWTAPW